MRIDILTLFPEMFTGFLTTSILGKAQEKGIVQYHLTDFRQFSGNKHGQVDDTPYGGGGGMVLKPEPIFAAVEDILSSTSGTANSPTVDENEKEQVPRIIMLTPQGEPYHQGKALELAQAGHLIFICGHYEGFDERIRQHLVTDEISIGDYVLTGGELPALVVIDSVVRLLPDVLGNESSAETDSFRNGLLEHPHYTRPAEFRGWKVPDVLLSGHHENIERWRLKESLRRTYLRRPDLLQKIELTAELSELLEEIRQEECR